MPTTPQGTRHRLSNMQRLQRLVSAHASADAHTHPPTGAACDAARQDAPRSITITWWEQSIPSAATGGTCATHATSERDALLSAALEEGRRLPTGALEMEQLVGLLLEGYSSGWLELRPPGA